MIVAHVMGLPIEESLLQLMPVVAVLTAGTGFAARRTFERARRVLRNGTRRSLDGGRS